MSQYFKFVNDRVGWAVAGTSGLGSRFVVVATAQHPPTAQP